jgi:anti-anti-sigma regulatory factor
MSSFARELLAYSAVNKYFISTLPAAFTAHAGNLHTTVGLSLRGQCDTLVAAGQLEQAIREVVGYGQPMVWVDCQRLSSLGWHSQRAIYNAHQWARVEGTGLYWCGLTPTVQHQLADTGLHLVLDLLPAASYRGPSMLLQDVVPQTLYTRMFTA